MSVLHNKSCGLYDSSRLYKTGSITPERNVKIYEIELYTYVTDGYSIVNGVHYPHIPGNILIAKPGDIRQSYVGQFRAYDIHFVCHDQNLSDNYLDKFPTILHTADIKSLINVFTEIIFSQGKQKKENGLYCIGKMYELISIINNIYLLNRKPDTSYFQHLQSIDTCMGYIKENYMKNISLEDAASIMHLSPTYFHIVFKNLIGITPCQYLTQVRLEAAQKMLINSQKSLSEIAFDSGFASQSYFSSVFKKEIGITPKNFRVEKYMLHKQFVE